MGRVGTRHDRMGIDPRKATYTAVTVDAREATVELGAGLGYLRARQLLTMAAGETVVDVPPVLAARVRIMGSGRSQKNDPNDARSVAIAAASRLRPSA